MRTRKSQLVLAGCLSALLAIWMLWPAGKEKGDDQRFRHLLRSADWGWRFRSAEKRLPSPLVRLLQVPRLRSRYLEKARVQEEALLASGCLTNTSVTITNLPVTAINEKQCLAEIQGRLRAGVHVDYLSFYMETNRAIVTCRSRDLALVRAAIQNP
jgi:hypothetical protein